MTSDRISRIIGTAFFVCASLVFAGDLIYAIATGTRGIDNAFLLGIILMLPKEGLTQGLAGESL